MPTGPACSKARARSGEAPARAMFEFDAARDDIPAGPDGTAFGLEITQIDGTTLELFSDPLLAQEFGVPAPGARPLLRLVGLLRSGTRRWKAAVIGRYLDGENALADGVQDAFGPGQLNLADRGFFSMDRWIRFSAAGADLLWRVIVSSHCLCASLRADMREVRQDKRVRRSLPVMPLSGGTSGLDGRRSR